MKKTKKQFRILKYLMLSIILLPLILLAVLLTPISKPLEPTGPYETGMETIQLEDTRRIEEYSDQSQTSNERGKEECTNRVLSVDYYYPQNTTGRFPLIIFSHGAFGIKTSNVSMYLELASHGYVVCAIGHTYQSLFTKIDGELIVMDSGYMNEVMEEDAKSNKTKSFAYYKKWMKTRTDDIRFVMDQTITQSNTETNDDKEMGFCLLVDSQKIGVIGHSLGGSAALGVGRICEEIDAVVALESPYLCDIVGVAGNEFVYNQQTYPVPVLNLYTDSTWLKMSNWSQYGTNNRMLAISTDRVWNVHLSGAGHFSITDLALSNPGLTRILNGTKTTVKAKECLEEVNRLTLAFFDKWLKGISQT